MNVPRYAERIRTGRQIGSCFVGWFELKSLSLAWLEVREVIVAQGRWIADNSTHLEWLSVSTEDEAKRGAPPFRLPPNVQNMHPDPYLSLEFKPNHRPPPNSRFLRNQGCRASCRFDRPRYRRDRKGDKRGREERSHHLVLANAPASAAARSQRAVRCKPMFAAFRITVPPTRCEPISSDHIVRSRCLPT